MTQEGEAKVTARCANLTRSSGWIIFEGHSFQSWVLGPIPLVHACWAAPTVATLGQLLPHNFVEIRVEPFMAPSSGDRGESQSNSAEAVVGPGQVLRRIP